jgi:hypothetical protein
MKNSCDSCKHMRAVDGKQNLQFHWPKKQCLVRERHFNLHDFEAKRLRSTELSQ